MMNIMGNKPIFSRRSSVTAFDLAHQGLQDVRLNDSSSELSPMMEPRPARFRNIIHEMLLVVACSFAGATFMFLQRSLVVILDPLQTRLHMSPSELSWTVAGPGLSTGALFLPMAFLVEHFRPVSRRYTLAGSLLLYSLLVGICAASADGIFLDVVVALAGITCALHLATAISILGSAYPFPSSRKTVATTFFLVSGNPAAIIVGSMLSGDISLHFTWRGSFVFLSILSALAAALSLVVVPDFDRQPSLKPMAKEVSDAEVASDELSTVATVRLDFDWRGTILLILAVGLFTVALTSAPEAHDGWSTPYVWLLFAISLVCLGMFVYWEKVTQHPLVPPPLWDNPGLLVLLLFVFLMSMAGCALIFWVPLFMETFQLQTALQTAVRLLPAAVTGICVSPLLSFVIHRVDHSLVAAVSAFCMISSSVALMYLRSDRDYWVTTFPAMILGTVAMDLSFGVATAAFSSALPLHHQLAGFGLVVTVARLAIPAGLAVTTAIHTSFAGRSDVTYPEVPYTNVFYATLSLSVLALTLVPFLRFDKASSRGKTTPLSMVVNIDASEDLDYRNFAEGPLCPIQPRKSSLYANLKKAAAEPEANAKHPEAGPSNLQRPGSHRSSATGDRVIWLVCEDCGASKRMVEQVGDPVRYFYDGGGNETAEQRLGSGDVSSASATSTVRRIPLCKDLNSLRG
ncbi:MFS general substrate transporter [Coniochaeta ligniaria NRRL 30616]|uniref:MFS general substrate transporter n=1 Tax=Coniochaeta ligniaria NRRL 30616 TaxID=1408157 RepID=A0A1J7J819_9PEZI|nr:MFS general substrate transporter [Coniochaeta ligniaria NRRL 30616]